MRARFNFQLPTPNFQLSTPKMSRHVNRTPLLLALAMVLISLSPSPAAAQDTPLTARAVVDRIKAHVGIPWTEPTVDTFKAGDPDTPVTGIAVTMMATFDVIQRAAAEHKNFVITHEPTFYSHEDTTTELEQERDALYKAKSDFIAAHHMVVWRFHDHWHRMNPDGIMTGMVRALAWGPYAKAGERGIFTMPEITLGDLAASIKQKLDAHTLRVVGDPEMKVTGVGLAPGFAGSSINRHVLQRPDVQVEVIGEAHEWEIVEYAADAGSANLGKALIVIGHIPSEQAGMQECVRWLKTFVSEVPVALVPAKQPFWEPEGNRK
jgi:putative NIF3 family GTP cyclohydrolase 1 type 2